MRVAGAILCGGASTRMGRDKAFVEIAGTAMVDRVRSVLAAAGCDTIVAVGGAPGPLALHGLDVIADEFPGEGPVGGVVSALHALHDCDVVVVVACDLPYLTASTVSALVANLTPPFEAAVAVPTGASGPSLCAAWRPSAAPRLEAAFAAGVRRFRTALESVPHLTLPVDPMDLRNVNAPGDLRQ